MKPIQFFACVLLIFSSAKSLAETLPIGMSLNMSAPDAQYDLEFKNGVEALFQAENRRKRFGKYQIELIKLDDKGLKERAISNTKRLITSKKVLALLSTHHYEAFDAISKIAISNKTLLLNSTSNHLTLPNYAQKYIGYLGQDIQTHLSMIESVADWAHEIIVSSSRFEHIKSLIRNLFPHKNLAIYPHSLDNRYNFDTSKKRLFIFDDNFIATSIAIKNIAKLDMNNIKVVVLADSGVSLVSKSLMNALSNDQLSKIYYISSIPFQPQSLSSYKQFEEDMNAYNPQANRSLEAFKGYLLASLLGEAVYKGVKGIKAESLTDVVTLPFQILDKVVGWVSHAGADISPGIIVDSMLRLNNVDNGLGEEVDFGKTRVMVQRSWLAKANKNGHFELVSEPEQGTRQ